MGRKRKYNKKSNRSTNKINNDMWVIILLVCAILLFVLIYGEKGTIGESLGPSLGGMLGIVKYIIPFGFIMLAISVAKTRSSAHGKIMQWLVFFACICGALSVYQISKGTLNADLKFSDILEASYDLGTKNIGGGTVGTVLAYPLTQLFGIFGASICLYGAVVILFVFMFGLSPITILTNFIEEKAGEEQIHPNYNGVRRTNRANYSPYNDVELQKKSKRQQNQMSMMDDLVLDNDVMINGHKPQEIESNDSGLTRGVKKLFGKKNNDDPEYIEANIHKDAANANVENMAKKPVENASIQDVKKEDDLFNIEEEKKEAKTKAILNLEHTVTVEDENYEYPPINILSKPKKSKAVARSVINEKTVQLQKTLHSFGVNAKVMNIAIGPTITRFEIKPAEGVRVSKIANLADDIALNLAAESIRIEAPIPGKQAVGIEIPNVEKEVVSLREVVESDAFTNNSSKLSVGLGKDVAGSVIMADIAKMPHVLIAGSTGSGKSVCINTIITSLIYRAKPSEVKMIMIDPKVVELSVYNEIPHLMIPVVTDPRKAAGALAWAVQEMDNRYNLFAQKGVRDIKGYNKIIEEESKHFDEDMARYNEGDPDISQGEIADEIVNRPLGKLPQMVIIVDELADLMMVASKEVEDSICRLAQKARAAGMHLIVATQRPSVDVITGLIKANIPSRIAFAVSSQIDSRTILDQAGAEKLLGKGDMLYYPVGENKPLRIQGAFVTDDEVQKIVDFVKANGVAKYNEDVLESIENAGKNDAEKDEMAQGSSQDADPLLMDVIDMVVEIGKASTSYIQRKFSVGYNRAGRIMDQMEERGIVSPYEGTKARKVLVTLEQLEELKATNWLENK